jgi:methyltransferase-like protein/ubiquinone/menaquinone biosynthesis C-methylase UbiE
MQPSEESGQPHSAAASGGDFDQLPYPSMPFAYTQPGHLAALATLYGLEPPPAHSARVLELGCASGGNIIPLATRFPKAHFVGIDLSLQHIRAGARRIEFLGLKNIELRHGDLAEAQFAPNTFDYLICHGVFSWVPRAVQDSILRICRTTLTAPGLAVVSYNVLPGWHLRNIVRDVCLRYVPPGGHPRERVAQARRVLADLAELTSETAPYGLFLRNEVKRLEQLPAAYVLGEFLSADNEPMHFRDFVAQIEQHDLRFLCEADLGSSIGEMLYPAVADRIAAQAGTDPLAEEQYKDFVSGRPFRRSVLINDTNSHTAGQSGTAPDPTRLSSLHVTSRLTQEPSVLEGRFIFRDARGRAITTKDSVVRDALVRLADAYPSSLRVAELMGKNGPHAGDAGERLCNALFALIMAHQAAVSTEPSRVGGAEDRNPKVSALTRLEAAARQPWLTSLTHEPIPAGGIHRDLLAQLDGRRDRSALRAQLLDWLRQGTLTSEAIKDAESLEVGAEQYLTRALKHLEINALLEA